MAAESAFRNLFENAQSCQKAQVRRSVLSYFPDTRITAPRHLESLDEGSGPILFSRHKRLMSSHRTWVIPIGGLD